MNRHGRLWLVLPSALVVLIGEDRCDRRCGVDERDLDVAIPLGAPPDKRQRGQDPFGVGEVLARCSAGWLGVHGPSSNLGQGPAVVCPHAAGPP
jgi:hypothetical protein